MKQLKFKKAIIFVAVVLMTIMLTSFSTKAVIYTESSEEEALFTEVSRTMASSESGVMRSRMVTLNTEQLGGIDGPPLDGSGIGNILVLNLFNETVITAVMDRLERNLSGSYSWIGHEIGNDGQIIVLTMTGDWMTGGLGTSQGYYSIDHVGNGLHEIKEIEPVVFGNDMMIPVVDVLTRRTPLVVEGAFGIDDGSLIDVMGGFTDDLQASSDAAIVMARIETGIAYTNQAYARSGVTQRVFLVNPAAPTPLMYPYDEPPTAGNPYSYCPTSTLTAVTILDEILCDVTLGRDGLDVVRTDRDTYHADLVAFFSQTGGGGLGWIGSNSIASNNTGYTASIGIDSNVSNLIAHEMGHNMGLGHEWYQSGNSGVFDYAHGYTDATHHFNTIMSYGNEPGGNSFAGGIANFSNDTILYNGFPTGIAAGTTVGANCGQGQPSAGCPADAADALNITNTPTSQFRASKVMWTGAASTDWDNDANWTIQEGEPGSTTSVNRVPRAIDDVVIPSTSNQPAIISGTMKIRAIVIETGAILNMSGGTLNVYGDWTEIGTGKFDGTGGEVIIGSPLDQEVTVTAASAFYHLTIGNGSTSNVTLMSDIKVNGNLNVAAGAHLIGGNNTIKVAGNWNEEAPDGFTYGTSTVIFNGTTQSVDETTSGLELTEDFSAADGNKTCSPMNLPVGWVFENAAWYGCDLGKSGRAYAAGDGWLYTTPVNLVTDVDYTIAFDFSRGSDSSVNVFYGTSAASANMTNAIGSISATGVANMSFTVPTAGVYYIGFEHKHVGLNWSDIDNVSLTGIGKLAFYNLTVASGTTSFGNDFQIHGNLTTNSGGIADLGIYSAAVEGTATNNGSLRQTKDAAISPTVTKYLEIKNAAGSASKYYGVDIVPAAAVAGTTVEIYGNQNCGAAGTLGAAVKRCYKITPGGKMTADVTFYYRNDEENGNLTPDAYHYNDPDWDKLSSTRGGSGDSMWVKADGVDSYSPFALYSEKQSIAKRSIFLPFILGH